MVRVYKKKTDRGSYGQERLVSALNAVQNGMAVLQASKQYGVPPRTIRRHRDNKVRSPGCVKLGRHQPVLPENVEMELHEHIHFMEKRLYGPTSLDVRRLAFEVAEQAKIDHPFNKDSRMAGKDWLRGFFARHQNLSLREPQGTNISRAVGFNKPKVHEFYAVYKELLSIVSDVCPSRVWNMDETGITNVQKPGKIVATKGARQVSKVTSGERGITVTVICAMSAAGVYLPPMFIFPRKRMVETLMNGAPPQSIGHCSPKGWTDSDLFLKWLQHFVTFTNSSKENPHIIILDGHHSHKSLAAIIYARDHGVHLITLPPHSTHKLQILEDKQLRNARGNRNAVSPFLESTRKRGNSRGRALSRGQGQGRGGRQGQGRGGRRGRGRRQGREGGQGRGREQGRRQGPEGGQGQTSARKQTTATRSRTADSDSSEDDEWPCIICCEPFSSSISGEEWVQCQMCLKWAHDACTPGNLGFICPNCDSD